MKYLHIEKHETITGEYSYLFILLREHSTKPIDMEEEEEEEEKVWASGVRQKCLEPDLADS